MSYINVRDFGALGDGQNDDTRAIQAALEASREGSVVFFPAGRYRIRPLKIPSHITLLGHAAWGYSAWGYGNNHIEEGEPVDQDYNGQTTLFPMPTNANALLDMSGCSGTRIIGLSLDGLPMMGKPNFHGISTEGAPAQNLVFEDVRISHFSGCGMKLAGTTGFAIRKSLIIKNTHHAVDASGAWDGCIMDNQLAYGDGAGFYAQGEDSGRFVINANRIEGGCPGGVYLDGAKMATIAGNSFDSNRGPGVTMLHCTGGSITGNMTRLGGRNQEGDANTHLRLETSSGITCMGNAHWGWPRLVRGRTHMTHYGMVIRELTDSVILGNTFQDPSDEELIRDYGGHHNTIIDMNQGKVYTFPE